jgi:phenylalanyl-tRNA synthetase beta chain
MKLPLKWLENYIKLEHTPQEFADIMTQLEFMQDGPMEEVNGQLVLDLEVRQNRPDSFSIIGLAREYAAYIGKKITLPEKYDSPDLKVEKAEELLKVISKDLTRRFYAIKITNIKVAESPSWMKENLEAYGIPSINNIVDITNYVMLEYGIPMHAFDLSKLSQNKDGGLLQIRKAQTGETIKTWQGVEIALTTKDLVVASRDIPVAIAGVIGGINSGIDNNTTDIILEAACYDQASIRKTSLRHSLRTDSSTRHEKFLNPEMVEVAMKRALYLINELCEGEIALMEDFYEDRKEPTVIEFNVYEIPRIGGVQMENAKAAELLNYLGFEIIDQKEAIGLNQNLLVIKVPAWRTDVKIEADILEEILRLWGYENIPLQPIRETPKDYSTTPSIQLEEKIKDILTSLGLDEYIFNPLVKFDENNKNQIKLENPLNQDKNALRLSTRETLEIALDHNQKLGKKEIAIFESGKIYRKNKENDFKEEKCISTLYYGHDFLKKIKPDLISVFTKLGLNHYELDPIESEEKLIYKSGKETFAILHAEGYDLYIENILKEVNLQNIPNLKLLKGIPQRSSQELSLHIFPSVDLESMTRAIYNSDDYIKSVKTLETYKNENTERGEYFINIEVLFESADNSLTGEKIEQIRNKMISAAEKFGARLR